MIETPLPPMEIRGRKLLPIIQGGMGVGVSAHRLAGTVAKEGAVGTIASVDLRRLHPDLMERTRRSRDRRAMEEANLEALDREIRAAREICGPEGFLAVNVMKAVDQHPDLVRQACESGADAIIMGAGLPFDLPDLVGGHDEVALIPILSEERGVRAVLKRWLRRGRLPDAIVIESPRYAGGHLGSPRVEEVDHPRFDFSRVIGEIRKVLEQLGIAFERIPLIAAGGINSFEKLRALIAAGWAGAQIGTPFAVTEEGDAHPNFKRVLAEARPEDIVTFLSTAGLPARAVLTPWLRRYLEREARLRAKASPERGTCAVRIECLTHCGLKDGNPQAGQFCIDNQLAAAVHGDVERGLFFRGSEPLPFGREIRPVRELLQYLLTGVDPRRAKAEQAGAEPTPA
ncbi:nitronate monooxygenase [Inmirania thermothiophila]|uniref:Nitronate monooxygenase n=2 Tax=Inmirania thermothiophila TaxID=1750597 RepID=A0A3N1Y554_9GAMM|nr:nitronate monooxygenase [Inmirania thermothiophila]